MKLALFVALVASCRVAFANTYALDDTERVACYALDDGHVLWERSPGPLSLGKLVVAGDALVVSDGSHRYALDPQSGEPVPQPAASVRRIALEPLGSLVDDAGRHFVYDPYNTHDLVYRAKGGRLVVERVLEDFVYDLNVVGHLAVFNHGSGHGAAGEVYAYDLRTRALAWDRELWRSMPELPEMGYTGVGATDDTVYVSADQVVFALDLATGTPRWSQRLPRQTIRAYDAPVTDFARAGDLLVAKVYDRLFVLDAETGAIRWATPVRPFSSPWPVVLKDRLCATTRDGGAEQMSGSFRPKDETPATAVRITRRHDRYVIEAISRRDAPAAAVLWSMLKPPPHAAGTLRVVLAEHFADTPTAVIPLDGILGSDGVVYVKVGAFVTSAALMVKKNLIAKVTLRAVSDR